MLPSAYLTKRQLEIWDYKIKGLSKAEIGRRLDITRQAVYDAEKIIHKKVETALLQLADVNHIQVKFIDSTQGILYGHHPSTDSQVVITFSSKNGVQTWHYDKADCSTCQWHNKCKSRLLDEAEERNITLSGDEKGLPASEIAHILFSQLIEGLDK